MQNDHFSNVIKIPISACCSTEPPAGLQYCAPVTRTARFFAVFGTESQSQPRLTRWSIGVACVSLLLPNTAWAHVKWFEPYDVSTTPTPVRAVLSAYFLLVFIGFMALLCSTFLLDRFATVKAGALSSPGRDDGTEEQLVRAGTGAFFMALFASGQAILTPELTSNAQWPAWIQLGIAISMLSTRTCLMGSIGILLLYSYAVVLYGFFHLSDYPMFIGTAIYLALASSTSERSRARRILALQVSICTTLMWGAIEKWAYPQWTLPLLAQRPYLTFGLSPQHFMVTAGFVEFTFAFYILTGLGLLRLAIFGLGTIFTAAILDFGKIDAIGHLPILVALAAMFLHGPTWVNQWFYQNSETGFRKLRTVGSAFGTTLCFFFGAYYGLQYAEFGPGPEAAPPAYIQGR